MVRWGRCVAAGRPHSLLSLALMAVVAPGALAHDGGEGWWGETNDQVITNAGFILIAFFPLLIFTMSMLQWVLEKRKDGPQAGRQGAPGARRPARRLVSATSLRNAV